MLSVTQACPTIATVYLDKLEYITKGHIAIFILDLLAPFSTLY